MHIKTGTWEASNAVCESDPLCDPAVLVAAPKPEPHIRNRRLSPGSGSCGGGGGGGGCSAGVDSKSIRQTSSNSFNESHRTGHTHVFFSSLHREQRVHARGNRGSRQDGGGMGPRGGEKNLRSSQTHTHKERWVGDTLSSLKPPPAFPVKDSPAKLQPAVSYASKVKAGGTSGGVAEEPPGIKVLLQNQWGLSFISDGPAVENAASVPPQDMSARSPAATPHPVAGEETAENSVISTSTSSQSQCSKEPKNSEELLLSCHHLVEAVEYHTQEWNAILWGQKQDPAKVAWYKDDL
ncbi:uncharacterized protein si:ch211-214j24.10 [Astyanax mexicanus]|uniref:uncharacterized protein si:ch211-214j24.10 n=1 Tax=Astyanax mexicanus TaxID=7994 RepID=UPI0020CACB90|nr:uncharacterized protein si:ch211-214j24.10 [Astyanax mexicanus]